MLILCSIVQNFMMNFIIYYSNQRQIFKTTLKNAAFGHAREVCLSVVSTNIKTLEIFSLEFVWSGPTEPNLNFLVRIFELHVNKSVTKIANRTQLYNLNVQIELLKYSTRINLRQRLPNVCWRVCKQTADQYVFFLRHWARRRVQFIREES